MSSEDRFINGESWSSFFWYRCMARLRYLSFSALIKLLSTVLSSNLSVLLLCDREFYDQVSLMANLRPLPVLKSLVCICRVALLSKGWDGELIIYLTT